MTCATCGGQPPCPACDAELPIAERPAVALTPEMAVASIAHRFTKFIDEFRGLVLNEVLFEGLVTFDVNGQREIHPHVPYAAVAVWNISTHVVTVTSWAARDTPPADGIGVTKINPGRWACIPITGTLLTLYGTAADVVTVAIYENPQPPGGGSA